MQTTISARFVLANTKRTFSFFVFGRNGYQNVRGARFGTCWCSNPFNFVTMKLTAAVDFVVFELFISVFLFR